MMAMALTPANRSSGSGHEGCINLKCPEPELLCLNQAEAGLSLSIQVCLHCPQQAAQQDDLEMLDLHLLHPQHHQFFLADGLWCWTECRWDDVFLTMMAQTLEQLHYTL
ncbi:hypothetical protein E2C01_021033 [Portunus trituberculatus]|uniref:Uncharacterized protein n=1 Tax=Portunus trituberculatus TaxID=210409 RepID=A0A5B7E3D1_PORTR|nr:hypothetical protein [Portunus trituberculatus]